jgi:hypothetical protein
VLGQSSEPNVFDLVFALDAEYPLYEAGPFCVGLSVVGNNRLTLGESLRYFN